MKVEFSKSFIKSVRKLSGKEKESIGRTVNEVIEAQSIEDITDCIRLVGYHSVYRIRIGGYRAFFTFHLEIVDDTVMFQYLVSRGQAYTKKVEKQLKRLDDWNSFTVKIGYARVSTTSQNLDMQLATLTDAGCEKIFSEKVSGVGERAELQAALQFLREGDTLVIYKLDRLGRSLKDLLDIIEQLQKRNISLVSLRDNIDTGSTTGKLTLHIFASLAEFERDLIKERTEEGRREAKKKGVRFGRPKQPKPEKANMCAQLYRNGNSVSAIMRTTGIKSRNTVYKYLRMEGIEITNK